MVQREWIRRCAARYVAVGDVELGMARLYAQTRAVDQAELYGESGAAWVSPEYAADEDMADWDEDE